jgi:hypothetical protein
MVGDHQQHCRTNHGLGQTRRSSCGINANSVHFAGAANRSLLSTACSRCLVLLYNISVVVSATAWRRQEAWDDCVCYAGGVVCTMECRLIGLAVVLLCCPR